MASNYTVEETVVTWCAVTKDGSILCDGNNNIEMRYHIACLERILHRGSLPLCMTRLAAKDICRAWNKGRSRHDSYWAMPKKIIFKAMEVQDGE